MSTMSTVEYLYYISNRYGFYSALFNLPMGLIGNILLILVFTNVKLFRGNQCSFYLTVESFSNIGLLIAIYSAYIFKYVVGYDSTLVSLPWCKIRTMLGQTCALCSLYTICSTTFDQYLVTNHHHTLRQMSTIQLAHRLIFFIVCFWTAHGTLFLIFTELRIPSRGCTVYNALLKKYLSFFYYPVLSNALPLLITVTFSLLAYRNVRRIVRRQVPLVRRRLDRQLTAMVLARVVCLVVLGLPFICVMLYQLNLNTSEDNYTEAAITDLIGAIFYSLLYTNFAISFYIFFAISSRFRRQMKYFLIKQCWRSMKSYICGRTMHLNANQVVPETTPRPVSVVESV